MSKLNGLKVAILVANGFEQIEMESPKAALEKEGAKTFIISPESNNVQGWHHYEKGDHFTIDVPLEKAKAEDYDALLLPGGVANPDKLRTLPQAIDFIKKISEEGKPMAVICHGPWLLINAGLAKDHQLTSWASVKTDLINAGAQWIDAPVVVDKKIVTSRKPDDLPQFNEAMVKLFAQT